MNITDLPNELLEYIMGLPDGFRLRVNHFLNHLYKTEVVNRYVGTIIPNVITNYGIIKISKSINYVTNGVVIVRFESLIPPIQHKDRKNFQVKFIHGDNYHRFEEHIAGLEKDIRILQELYVAHDGEERKQSRLSMELVLKRTDLFYEKQKMRDRVYVQSDKYQNETYIGIISYGHGSCSRSVILTEDCHSPWYDQIVFDAIYTESEFIDASTDDFEMGMVLGNYQHKCLPAYMEMRKTNTWFLFASIE